MILSIQIICIHLMIPLHFFGNNFIEFNVI